MAGSRPDGPHRLAVAVSGGISLGAFFAGVTYELVRLARARRLQPDVWAGASAGAMTAALACWCLALDQDPWPLYEAWVLKADMRDLVAAGGESILDSDYLQQVIDAVLPGDGSPAAQVVPHNDAPCYLGMTVTNLNGLVCRPGTPPDLRLRNYAETRYFRLAARPQHSVKQWQDVWQKIRRSVRMSGSFPLAFAPVTDDSQLRGQTSDNLADPELCLDRALYLGDREDFPVDVDGELNAVYSDGGVVHNKPVRLAIQLVERLEAELDRGHLGHRYLFIEGQKVSGLDDGAGRQRAFDHLDVAEAALTLAREQMLWNDMRLVHRRNELARRRDELARELRRVLGLDEAQPLPGELEGLLAGKDGVCPYRQVDISFATPLDALRVHEAHGWLRPDRQAQIEKWRNSRDWDRLDAQDWDELERDVRTESLVACDFLAAFGGFFHKRYRDYDFALGRLSAIGWLRRLARQDPAWGAALPPGGVLAWLAGVAVPDGQMLTPVGEALLLAEDPGARALGLQDNAMLFEIAARGLAQAATDASLHRPSPDSQEDVAARRWLSTLLLGPLAALLKALPRRG